MTTGLLFGILPILMTIAWLMTWVGCSRIPRMFFVHAFSACLVSLVLAAGAVSLEPRSTPGSGGFLDGVYWVCVFNTATGVACLVVLVVATEIVNGIFRFVVLMRDGPPQKHRID